MTSDADQEFKRAMFWFDKDGTRARIHVEKACQSNHAEALYRLGLAHGIRPWDFELGITQSPRYGRTLLERASALGHIQAEFLLAVSYLDGTCGVRQHQDKGFRLLKEIETHNTLARKFLQGETGKCQGETEKWQGETGAEE